MRIPIARTKQPRNNPMLKCLADETSMSSRSMCMELGEWSEIWTICFCSSRSRCAILTMCMTRVATQQNRTVKAAWEFRFSNTGLLATNTAVCKERETTAEAESGWKNHVKKGAGARDCLFQSIFLSYHFLSDHPIYMITFGKVISLGALNLIM